MIFDSTTVALVFQEERDESILIVGINEFQTFCLFRVKFTMCGRKKRNFSAR